MKPILFSSTDTTFDTNGIGRLDPMACTVTEKRNGEYELQATLSVGGQWVDQIGYRSIICARPAPGKDPQPFRVYRIVKTIGGTITVYARHISYDLSGILVMPFKATNVADVFSKMHTYSTSDNPFAFWTDIGATFDYENTTPVSCRAVIGALVEEVGAGDLEWDNYTVKYRSSRGANRGLVIRYGKNMTDFKQEANCAEVYTGIYPYYYDQSNDNYVEIDGCILKAEGTFSYEHYLPVDLTSYFTELDEGETPTKDTELAYGTIPTKAQLKAVAQQYLEDNEIGVPDVSIDVNFAQLAQSMEYKDLVLLESCYLCDTVSVSFPQMNVVALAQVVETEFNVLTDKYDNLVLGNAQKDYVASQYYEQMETLQKVVAAAAQAKKEAQKAANTSATNLANAVTKINADLVNLQSQVDGNIATWFYAYVPTLDNVPASDWTTDNDKNVHLGDLFYNTKTGYAYRFMLSNGTYQWTRIIDTDVTKALADAATAQDTADGKRRVFYSTPTPPYDQGDLWVQGSDGDILRCQVAKTKTGKYAASDWVLASKYTDDTKAEAVEIELNNTINSVKSSLQTQIESATKQITGNLGGYVVLHDSDGDNEPDEILIMNSPSIGDAKKVWRWNKEGLGYSSTGYNGLFGLAITAEGKINADYILTGELDASKATIKNLNASKISTGTLTGITIEGNTIKGNTITGGSISGTTIDGNTITSGSISGADISGGSLSIGGLEISSKYSTVYIKGNLEVQGSLYSTKNISTSEDIIAFGGVSAINGFAPNYPSNNFTQTFYPITDIDFDNKTSSYKKVTVEGGVITSIS